MKETFRRLIGEVNQTSKVAGMSVSKPKDKPWKVLLDFKVSGPIEFLGDTLTDASSKALQFLMNTNQPSIKYPAYRRVSIAQSVN